MRRSQPDPWANVAQIAAIAALVGAGVGASGALFYAERRVGGMEVTLDALRARVAQLEERLRTPERGALRQSG